VFFSFFLFFFAFALLVSARWVRTGRTRVFFFFPFLLFNFSGVISLLSSPSGFPAPPFFSARTRKIISRLLFLRSFLRRQVDSPFFFSFFLHAALGFDERSPPFSLSFCDCDRSPLSNHKGMPSHLSFPLPLFPTLTASSPSPSFCGLSPQFESPLSFRACVPPPFSLEKLDKSRKTPPLPTTPPRSSRPRWMGSSPFPQRRLPRAQTFSFHSPPFSNRRPRESAPRIFFHSFFT